MHRVFFRWNVSWVWRLSRSETVFCVRLCVCASSTNRFFGRFVKIVVLAATQIENENLFIFIFTSNWSKAIRINRIRSMWMLREFIDFCPSDMHFRMWCMFALSSKTRRSLGSCQMKQIHVPSDAAAAMHFAHKFLLVTLQMGYFYSVTSASRILVAKLKKK